MDQKWLETCVQAGEFLYGIFPAAVLKKMRPVSDSEPRVAVLFDIDDPRLEDIGLVRDDSIVGGTPEKAEAMGLDTHGLDVTYDELALELVAMLDVEKA